MGTDDKKNLITAIILSVVVLLGWQVFYEAPRNAQEQRVQQALRDEQARQTGSENVQQGTLDQSVTQGSSERQGQVGTSTSLGLGAQIPAELQSTAAFPKARDRLLTESPRLIIDTPLLRGSLSLKGARLDDITLNNYRETIDPESDNIVLLNPKGSETPYYAEFGWLGEGFATPTTETVWTANKSTLRSNDPVTLTWDNGAGVMFEQVIELDENYLFTVTQRVRNNSPSSIALSPYGLVRRVGTPETLGFYILHEGLLGVFNGTLEEIDYDDLLESGLEPYTTTGGWLGITDKYWLVALVPDQSKNIRTNFQARAPGGTELYQADFLTDAVTIGASQSYELTSRLFAGAKLTTLLDRYGADYDIVNFDLAVDFGWFYWLTKPIFYVIHWLNEVLGNFGLAILALTVGIKLIFFPLANKSYHSMSKMKLLQPKMIELKERYEDDRQGLNKAMMELYQKEKVNPLSGCLPILVQIPVFFALYKVLFVTIEMRHAPFFGWIHDLSAPDPLGLLTLFGLIPWEVPAVLAIINIGIWPIIMGGTMYLQQKLNPAPADPIQARVFMLMPFFFTFLLGTFSAGLVIYWAWNNFLSIVQQYIIMRRMGVAIGGGKASASPQKT